MRASPLKDDFTLGEISPLAQGRPESPAYKSGVGKMLNFITNLQGSVIRRPGTHIAYGYNGSSVGALNAIRLAPFVFNNAQSYVIELGNNYAQFYTQEQPIETAPNTPYFISTPWASTDLALLRWAQVGDTMYFVHPNYQPYVLSRFTNVSWTLTAVSFVDGPYLNQNLTATTFALSSGTAGTGITLTASTATFVATDVGRSFRMNPAGTQWGWGTITAYTSATVVTVTLVLSTGSTTATKVWRLGLWSVTTGWPSCCCFHQQRFCLSGAAGDPLMVNMSVSSSYLDFTPTNVDSTVTDSNAVAIEVYSPDQDGVHGLVSNTAGLQVFTTSTETLVSAAAAASAAITATDVQAIPQSNYGISATVAPVPAGRSTLFIQRAGRKLREMYYYYYVGGFESEDISLYSEHLTDTGIKELAFQREPIPILWMCRNDGTLVGVTYQRKLQEVKVGWHEHALGGQSTMGGDPPVVESVCVIPTVTAAPFANGTRDELWLVVRRMDGNGGTVRTIEYMDSAFALGQFTLPVQAEYLDCAQTPQDGYFVTNAYQQNPVELQLNAPPNNFLVGDKVTIDGMFGMTQLNGNVYNIGAIQSSFAITAITKANPAVVTSASHPFVTGQQVYLTGIGGMTQLNGVTATITKLSPSTFSLTGINSTGYSTFTSGGIAYGPYVTLTDRHGNNIDGTNFSAFRTGPNGIPGISRSGVLVPQKTSFGPFFAFAGAPSLQVLGDGSTQTVVPDASGNVTLGIAAGFVTIGFPYTSDIELLRFDAGAQDGTSFGKTRRSSRIGVLVFEEANLKVGYNGFTNLQTLQKGLVNADPTGTALYSGILSFTPSGQSDYSLDDLLCLRMDTPLPCTILAVMPQMETQDRM